MVFAGDPVPFEPVAALPLREKRHGNLGLSADGRIPYVLLSSPT